MRRRYPFDCVGCGREISRSRHSGKPGLAHAGHGLCQGCMSAWRRAGRPDRFARDHAKPLKAPVAYPFDCASCARPVVRPQGSDGEGLADGGGGLCVPCRITQGNLW